MMIKVCGMRDPENIRDVEKLSIDMMGFNFCKDDPRHVGMMRLWLPLFPIMQTGDLSPKTIHHGVWESLLTTCRRTSSRLYIITSSIVFNFKAASRQ